MPLNYYEAFGFPPDSDQAAEAFRKKLCPFVGGTCHKQFKGGILSGSCSLTNPSDGVAVPVCPKRLYAQNHKILQDVAFAAATKLPPQGVYEAQIRKALAERLGA